MARRKSDVMTDKERVLMAIIRQLSSTLTLCYRKLDTSGFGLSEMLDLESLLFEMPKSGDLVLCQTSGVHPWTVAYVVRPTADGALLREIGSERLCNMGNEGFQKIVNLREPHCWEGERHKFYLKVQKAFRKLDSYWHRYGGLRFDGDTATIVVREAFGGAHGADGESVPYEVAMPWSKRTPIRSICAALTAAGFDTRKFERRPKTIQETS